MKDARGYDDVHDGVEAIAQQWRGERAERQARRHLERSDFDALAGAGFLLTAVPHAQGGCWRGVAESTRPLCEILRAIATADASVALVASMHPAVLGYWLATSDPDQPEWEEQRAAVFAVAARGSQWGTITSEPGSGGDIMRTKTRAVADDAVNPDLPGGCYRLTGDKHFGSGFGISDFMFTTAVAEGEDAPSAFAIDMRDRPEGSVTVVAEWDGAGMTATQSHAARLEGAPAVRLAWAGPIDALVANAGPCVMAMFSSVVLGVFDAAVELARTQLAPKREGLRAFEQVEWSRADRDHWLAVQAYEGLLRTIETGDGYRSLRAALRAKTAIADLAEDTLRRITQVLGGGTFSRRSAVANWFEDVRALGFLRPPWGLAYDNLFNTSFDT
jgi:alkylation response protein AidB-like acyl-CoA dehydrogenase